MAERTPEIQMTKAVVTLADSEMKFLRSIETTVRLYLIFSYSEGKDGGKGKGKG